MAETSTTVSDDDSIIMSVRLKSGLFASSIEVPVYSTQEQREEFVAQWLLMMEAGLRVGQSNRKARTDG